MLILVKFKLGTTRSVVCPVGYALVNDSYKCENEESTCNGCQAVRAQLHKDQMEQHNRQVQWGFSGKWELFDELDEGFKNVVYE